MHPMLKYLDFDRKISKLSLIPVVIAVILLTLFAFVVTWTGVHELLDTILKNSDEILYAIRLSLITASIASLAALILGIPVAYALSRKEFIGKKFFESVIILPFGMPPVALGAILLIFFTNSLIGKAIDRILNIVFNIPGIILAQFFIVYPMVIRVLKSSFDMVDPRYEAVARTLGYGSDMVLIKVTLPMARRGVFTALILAFTRSLGEFGATVTLAGATRFKTETLPIAIYLSLSTGELTLTVSFIMVLAIVAVFILIALYYVEVERVSSL